MAITFSIIVPVYNRPQEVRELLNSIAQQHFQGEFEVVIVEDGSSQTCEAVIAEFDSDFTVVYLQKPNTGPGDSRNFGMEKARNNYFIILDSDCILADGYLAYVAGALVRDYTDCFGGPDAAHETFTAVQKAIDFSMTSFLTTGGIRGSEKAVSIYEPRSFNMGLSKKAFEAVGGFRDIHPGEDPDLVWRLFKAGYKARFLPGAVVYHKRRIDFKKFYSQVRKFGMVRPILNKWHPESARVTHWFPSVFTMVLPVGIGLWLMGYAAIAIFLLSSLGLYLALVLIVATMRTRSLKIGFYALIATIIQFYGYGTGFLKSVILTTFSKKEPRELFPELFF